MPAQPAGAPPGSATFSLTMMSMLRTMSLLVLTKLMAIYFLTSLAKASLVRYL